MCANALPTYYGYMDKCMQCSWSPTEGSRFTGTGVRDDCELTCPQ